MKPEKYTMPQTPIIYLDAASTTPCSDEVIQEMLEFSKSTFGNPSSSHLMGRLARCAICESTSTIAKLLGCRTSELIFTSGATESNNIVILGSTKPHQGSNIIVCPIDHKSTLAAAEELERRNIEVRKMRVTSNGRVDIDHLSSLLDERSTLLSISYVNSEIGTFQNLKEIRLALNKNPHTLFHVDAAQALGKIPINLKKLGVDCASFSAHKIGGPKGIGILYASQSAISRLQPLTFGGGQSPLRSGTLPTQLIVGFGAAARRIQLQNNRDSWNAASQRRTAILEIFKAYKIPYLTNSPRFKSTPHILNITITGIQAETLISHLGHVCISSGSACNAHDLRPSHVITGIGHDMKRATSSIRLSFTSDTDIDLIRNGAEVICKTISALSQTSHRSN
ncbi:cysteine desulfurase family protein [Pseudomonas sp. NPDC089407]|uniref:cysteine desulfurase family protein n=1 Tax=Pseudomonas sp. NPDC089407 TaxID=3364464 RepID=UPI00384A6DFC